MKYRQMILHQAGCPRGCLKKKTRLAIGMSDVRFSDIMRDEWTFVSHVVIFCIWERPDGHDKRA